jgi:hypothetical protein
MYRILAFILMLCLTVPVSVLAAPNPNDNALEKASDNARFNRDDDRKGKKDKKHNDDDDDSKGKKYKKHNDDDDMKEKKEKKSKNKGDKKKKK